MLGGHRDRRREPSCYSRCGCGGEKKTDAEMCFNCRVKLNRSLRVAAPKRLTPRETQVVALLAQGYPLKAVADKLRPRVAYNTADVHRSGAFRKIGVTSVAGLVHWAVASGLVKLGQCVDAVAVSRVNPLVDGL